MSLAPDGRLLVHPEKPPPAWLVREDGETDRYVRGSQPLASVFISIPLFFMSFFEGGHLSGQA